MVNAGDEMRGKRQLLLSRAIEVDEDLSGMLSVFSGRLQSINSCGYRGTGRDVDYGQREL